MITLYVSNDTPIRVRRLRSASTGALLNNQVMNGAVLNADGTVLGTPVTFSLAYVPESEGDYLGLVPDDAALTAGENYLVQLAVDAGPGLAMQVRLPATARVRTQE